MLQKQSQELNHRLSMISAQQPAPPPPTQYMARAETNAVANPIDATAALLLAFKALVDEIKNIRNKNVKLKSFKDICGLGINHSAPTKILAALSLHMISSTIGHGNALISITCRS